MTLFETILIIFCFCALAMAGVWLLALKIHNIGIVDVAWAGLMALAGLFCACTENVKTHIAAAANACKRTRRNGFIDLMANLK